MVSEAECPRKTGDVFWPREGKKEERKKMARVLNTSYERPRRAKRPGVHAKTRTSKVKGSRNYKKLYKGQGR